MNPKLLLPIVCALALSAAPVIHAAVPGASLLGDPAPASAANRTIVIGPDTRWVNVTGGEIVKFVAGGREFAWHFNGADSVSSFPLNRIAPQGVLDHPVTAYIAPDPLYSGQ